MDVCASSTVVGNSELASGFDGHWIGKGTIRGGSFFHLFGETGEVTKSADKTITIVFANKSYQGRLMNDGTLKWNDGSSWVKSSSPFAVGEPVEARRIVDNHWCQASIVNINVDGTFTIDSAECASDADRCKPECDLRKLLVAGYAVEGRCFQDNQWYGAAIKACRGDGTFILAWDDPEWPCFCVRGVKDLRRKLLRRSVEQCFKSELIVEILFSWCGVECARNVTIASNLTFDNLHKVAKKLFPGLFSQRGPNICAFWHGIYGTRNDRQTNRYLRYFHIESNTWHDILLPDSWLADRPQVHVMDGALYLWGSWD